MMQRLFRAGSASITSAAFIVAVFSVMSRVAGFVRDRILIDLFGAGATLDAYYQAMRVPDFLLQLFVVGALSASFIPFFTRYYLADQEEKAWRYTNAMLFTMLAGFAAVAVVGATFAPQLAQLVALKAFTEESRALVAQMMRVMFLGQCFFAVSLVFGSVLQGAKRFVLYAFAPIANNVGIILGALFLVPVLGPVGLAWGAVLGAAFHVLVQVVGVFSLGYVPRFVAFWREKDVRQSLLSMGPRVLGLAVNQVNFLLMGIIAGTLMEGSVTVFNLAYNLNFFPIGVIAVSYAIAAYPTFCEYVHAKDTAALRNAFATTVRQVLFFMIPLTVVFLLLRAQIVRVMFGAEGFDWVATITTAETLGYFAVSFFAQAIVYVLVRMYFALEDTATPLIVGLLAALVNVVGAVTLAPQLGVQGLGIAFSASAIVQAAVLWVLLRLRLGSLHEGQLVRSVATLSLAGIVCAATMQAVKYVVGDMTALDTFWDVAWQSVASSGAGLALYAILSYLLKSPDALAVAQGLRRKLIRSARPAEVTEVV